MARWSAPLQGTSALRAGGQGKMARWSAPLQRTSALRASGRGKMARWSAPSIPDLFVTNGVLGYIRMITS
ncbi:MAG: hypothetical protein IH600_08125 [Bacteroidetes bacterium]|nr:hypothetical protein [Bacteroidota bacterium]